MTIPERAIELLRAFDWGYFLKEKYLAIMEALEQEGFLPERDLLASLDLLRGPPVSIDGIAYRLYYSPYHYRFQVRKTAPKGELDDIMQSPDLGLILSEWRAFQAKELDGLQTKLSVRFVGLVPQIPKIPPQT